MFISNKVWELNGQNVDNNEIINNISRKFNISSIIANVLTNRGLKDDKDIEKFLYPNLSDFYNPFLLKDMDKATERIITAINKKEKIMIYGDYDVDGITSTSILFSYLNQFTDNVEFYIPDRIEDGYGLSISSIGKIISKKANLIITVDCGITAVEEIEYIKKQGIDVVITDHHECKDIIPDAVAVVNPKQKDCKYPFKELAGVGVVFKLLQALAQKMDSMDVVDKFIDIVALGTVADVVPLIDENRIIVKYGLSKIEQAKNLGIKALINVSGLQGKTITAVSIGYIMAPRVNAAGRIGNAIRGVDLFLSKTEEEANEIALELDQENKNRQQTENIILNEALQMIEQENLKEQKVIVIASEGWHHGVIGIVSSRLTEKFYKPAILISLDGDLGKGSGRSISGFNLFEALTECSHILEKFGGHELAVGLSVKKEKINEFRIAINELADKVLSQEDFYPKIKIDSEISKDDLTLGLANELKILEPFGMGNPCPMFGINNLKIIDCRTVGEDKHIKLKMEDDGLFVDAIGFNLGEVASKIDLLDKVDVVCGLENNVWNSQEKLQLNIKDIRTNQEVIFKEKYYNTLEYSMMDDLNVDEMDKSIIKEINIFDGNITNLIENGQKNVILVNTLSGAKSFIDTLRKEKLQHKEGFKVYYNNNIGKNIVKNIAIINPHFNNISFSDFDNVFMYDLCFNKKQYSYLIKNSKKLYFMNNFKNHDNLDVFNEIIPQREELIKIYQYIKNKSWDKTMEGDILSLARTISLSYNVDINCLKLKNAIDTFKEMGLISMDLQGNQYKINLVKQSGAKINIHESKGLSKLIKIKDEFNYFIKYLKEN